MSEQVNAVANGYVYLKNISGTVIKPITDLSAINMTTTNGIAVEQVNGGTIGIRDGYIESCYYAEMVDPGVGPGNVDSAYIEGGTMFTLIGGYTVTDEIPPITDASHEKIPSEYSVRSAIDALATLGPSLAPGAGIVVETIPGSTGGTIAVAGGDGIEVNTAQTGGVSVKAGNGITVDSTGVNVDTATNNTFGGIAGATNGVQLVNGVAQINEGSGLKIGASTTSDAGKVVIDEASVETTLQDVRIDGASTVTPVDDQVVTPGNLRGALSVGQAVDVSCAPTSSTFEVKFDNDDTWYPVSSATAKARYLEHMTLRITNATKDTYLSFGFSNGSKFPKRAPGLRYLMLVDFVNRSNTNISTAKVAKLTGYPNALENVTGVPNMIPNAARAGNANNQWMRLACLFSGDDISGSGYGYLTCAAAAAGTLSFELKNFRQYEVTALTDEAIAYLANYGADPVDPVAPDAFFRSSTIFQVRDKYLIKQDMVCPWIFTIKMDDNKDLTVAAGLSYKIRYTNDSPHKITVDTIPADAYGWDAHIQMFIKGTSSIVFQKPLILMDALTPNAGHNLLVKFRNGDAYVYVEDTNAGYIVTEPSGTGAGTLNFGIVDPDTDYVIFAAALDGATVDAGTAAFVGGSTITTLNILGNGTDKTSITGDIGAASGKTINLQSLTIDGGTLGGVGKINLDGVNINGECTFDPQTVYHEVYPYHIVINENSEVLCNATRLRTPSSTPVTISGVANSKITFQNDTGYIECNNDVTLSGVTVTGDAPSVQYGLFNGGSNYNCSIINCTLNNNTDNPTVKNTKNIVNSIVLKRGDANNAYGTIQVWTSNFTCNIIDSYIGFSAYGATALRSGLVSIGSDIVCNIQGSTIYGTFSAFDASRGNCYFYFSGSNTCSYSGSTALKLDSKTFISIADNSIMHISEQLPGGVFLRAATNKNCSIGDNVTFIGEDNRQFSIDACNVSRIETTGKFYNADAADDGDYIVITSMLPIWKATNIIFAYTLDAAQANTIKLTGTTFTAKAKTLNANRIQLPAATTVSFQGNSNAADTKILQAAVMLVGDNAASPSGSATIINADGVSSSVSGIGTYIDKEGDNDFRPVTSNFNVSNTASSGAGSLLDRLTSASAQATSSGMQQFVGFVSGGTQGVASFGAATDIVSTTILTKDYQPVFGGNYTVSAGGVMTVDQATKTATVSNGAIILSSACIPQDATLATPGGISMGAVSTIEITGGGTVNLAGYHNLVKNRNATISGVTITGFSNSNQSTEGSIVITNDTGNKIVNVVDCTFTGNYSVVGGALAVAANAGSASVISATRCNFYGNGTSAKDYGLYVFGAGELVFTDCQLSTPVKVQGGGTAIFAGSNCMKATVEPQNVTASGFVTISSGAVIDLTGNTNSVPIAPGDGITFGASVTVINSAGSSVLLNGGEAGSCSVIKNDGTIE